MSRAARHPAGRLDLVLPPGWTMISLEDADARGRAVRLLVSRAGLDDGQGAVLRRELHSQLSCAADRAFRSGASTLAICTTGPGGVPLPASLVVTFIPGGTVPSEQEAWLQEAGGRLDTASVPAGRVVRRVANRVTSLADGEPAGVTTVVVDYWLTREDGAGVVHLAASTPLVHHEAAMVGLFDAVIESARWSSATS